MSHAPDEYIEIEDRVLEAMRPDLDEEEFNTVALQVYWFQRIHNRPYGKFCAMRRDARNWREIPAAPQSAFKQYPLRSFPGHLTTKTFRTSGTTGEGFGEHHFLSMRVYDEAILRGWDFFKLPGLPQVILTPSPGQSPHSSLSHMMGVLQQRAESGEQHFCMGDNGDLQIDKIGALIRDADAPMLVMGTALAFLHWLERGEEMRLPAGSFALETGGYKGSGRSLGKRELYEMIGDHLGLAPENIINEYGMTELGSQFYTRGLGHAHLGPPWMRALVIDPETGGEAAIGETGVLRIFDLANPGSVMAIQTRDLAIRCENGFELLGRDPTALPRGCSRAADEMLS